MTGKNNTRTGSRTASRRSPSTTQSRRSTEGPPKPKRPVKPQRRRGWFTSGLARGALAGLLTATTLGCFEAILAASRATDLGGSATITLGAYAIGLIGLVMVPFGAFVGAGLSAWFTNRKGTLGSWFNELACDHTADVTASSRLVGGLAAGGALLLFSAVFHYAVVHDLNNPLMASVFVAILMLASLTAAAFVGGIFTRASGGLISRLPFEALGRPHMTKFQGIAYLALGSAGIVGLLGFWRFYNPEVWAASFITAVVIALVGPGAFFALLSRADRRGRWSGHPIIPVFCMLVVVLLSLKPIFSFRDQEAIRAASLTETELERRLLAAYMASVGDRDGDGYAGLFGGPDCNDANSDINPSAFDTPENGVDENCINGDAKAGRMRARGANTQLLDELTSALSMSVEIGKLENYHMALQMRGAATADAGKIAYEMILSAKTGRETGKTPPPELKAKGMNVMLIVIDTVRVDHLSMSGYERPTTPELDKLASKSIVFTHAYAHAPNTPRSVPSLVTSRYPSEIIWRKRAQNFSPVMDPNTTLFEVLQGAGYRNHFVGSHWYFRPYRNLQQGFHRKGYDNAGSLDIAPSNTDISSPRVMGRVKTHLKQLKRTGKPWSMMVHLADPHGRYMKHPGKVPNWGNKLMDKYDQELRFVDNHIGKLLKEIERLELDKNTIIIITSDHGEAFGEHKHHFHGQTLYEEILRVPLIIRVPGLNHVKVDTPVELIDIAPTVLDALKIEIPEEFRGRSLVAAMLDPKALAAQPVYAEHLACRSWDKEMRVLVDGQYKIYWRVTEGLFELYDLKADPGEQNDIFKKKKDVAERMKSMIAEFVERELDVPK